MISASDSPRPRFLTTRWSLVLAARSGRDAGDAMETLCRTYWYPLYGFVRSRGHSVPDAQDLTQEFFARLLDRRYLDAVSPERGRFRTFLRMALRRFLANEWDRARSQKRGGKAVTIPLDADLAECRLADDREGSLPPDRTFDRRWAQTVLDEAAARLAKEYAADGREKEFQILRPHLTAARGDIPYAEIAAELETTPGPPAWPSTGCAPGFGRVSAEPWRIPSRPRRTSSGRCGNCSRSCRRNKRTPILIRGA